MTCKDCLHYEVCADFRRNICEIDQQRFEEYKINSDGLCDNFKNKAYFVELPCKVGDTVYSIDNEISSQIFVGEVYEILVRKNIVVFRYTRKGYYSGGSIKEDFGKTVFLTRKEAEAALNKLQEDN